MKCWGINFQRHQSIGWFWNRFYEVRDLKRRGRGILWLGGDDGKKEQGKIASTHMGEGERSDVGYGGVGGLKGGKHNNRSDTVDAPEGGEGVGNAIDMELRVP